MVRRTRSSSDHPRPRAWLTAVFGGPDAPRLNIDAVTIFGGVAIEHEK